MDLLFQFGLIGLFLASFLAATILPFSSELVLSAVLLGGASPLACVALATAGNVLGAITNYLLGFWARWALLTRWFGVSQKQLSDAEQRFQRLGYWALCLTWVPVIGDPIAIAAGALRIRFRWFIVLVTLSKGLRYIVLSYLVLRFGGMS